MKRYYLAGAIVFCMLVGLSACSSAGNDLLVGETENSSSETENPESENTGSESAEITGEVDPDITEENNVPGDISYDVAYLSEKQENMLPLMDARCTSMGGSYICDDENQYILKSIFDLFVYYENFFVYNTGYAHFDTEHSQIFVEESFVNECVSLMFADLGGEIPSISNWHDSIIKEDGYYYFGIGDRGDELVNITSWTEHPDGSCTVVIQYSGRQGEETYKSFQIELAENEDNNSAVGTVFKYKITSVSVIDHYILPDSDSRYYTTDELTDELSGYYTYWLRLARNEIYARHGRIFEDETLQYYFECQTWYEGTTEPSEFNEDVLNKYEKANIETIKALEAES